MRRAAIATVACALAAAVSPTETAAQARVPPAWPDAPRGTRGGTFDRLFDEAPASSCGRWRQSSATAPTSSG